MTMFRKPSKKQFNAGNKVETHLEEKIVDIGFHIHKFSDKPKPDKSKVIITSCFSEFGCEILGAMYCVPRICAAYKKHYIIVMGWHGRDYLYKHLVDEFWELKEEFQWLREYTYAFHHESRNLAALEKSASQHGSVIASSELGKFAVGNACNACGYFWPGLDNIQTCLRCNKTNITKALFADIPYWKKKATLIPRPSAEKMAEAAKYIKPNSVGVFARNRKAYGRNLPPEFYVKLVTKLKALGYNPIWLGEKQTTLPCPVEGVTDLLGMARDLELTLAIVSQLKFTIQFWTASTRIAGMMGVPYLLFESPDQLFGNGQEAYRLSLCTMGNRKIALCHYLNVLNDHEGAVDLVERCLSEMEAGNWNEIIGMVDKPEVVYTMKKNNASRLV